MSCGIRGVVAALVSLGLAAAPPAIASTVTKSGGRMIYTAAAGKGNSVELEEGNDFELRLKTLGDPVETIPAGCYDNDGNPAAPHGGVTCNGITVVEVDTGDLNDIVDAEKVISSIRTIIRLGDGSDQAIGSQAIDEIHGGAGDDVISGGASADEVFGNAGADSLVGDCGGNAACSSGADGADVVDGGDGSDILSGNGGDDTLLGGPGDDLFDTLEHFVLGPSEVTQRDAGDDAFAGGPGFDRVRYQATATEFPLDTAAIDVVVTLDGVADDGQQGEADNIGADVEDVEVLGSGWPHGSATVTATAALNSIRTADGPDTIDPGAGPDFVDTAGGDDTIRAVDGFADRIACGPGVDVADVDEFDATSDCETVNVFTLGRHGAEDAAPVVAWVSPAADGVRLGSGRTTLSASADDDRGVTQVVFLAGSRVLCADTTAPFECAFSPTDADVGKATLTAVAYDAMQQTATALRFVDVDRFRPSSLGLKVRPKRDRRLPFKFRATGALELPPGVSAGEGCRGRVQVRLKVGKKTISARKAKVRDNCSYKRRVKFTQRYRLRAGKLRVFATFLGNDVLKRKKAARQKVRIGG